MKQGADQVEKVVQTFDEKQAVTITEANAAISCSSVIADLAYVFYAPHQQVCSKTHGTYIDESGHPYLPSGDERGQLGVLSLSVVLSVLPKRHGSLVNM
uniref:Uncharacterized protein n=1 Tax=Timema monikensis TaxID=170555 RepID=A0A7R9EGM4_9NEOP|nr:unnamed protein product [Timema monikensis]